MRSFVIAAGVATVLVVGASTIVFSQEEAAKKLVAKERVATAPVYVIASGAFTAVKTVHTPKGIGCDQGSTCVHPAVAIDPSWTVVATHCRANIDIAGGWDLPHYTFNEVPTDGREYSWSKCDPFTYVAAPGSIVVSTTFHNKSTDRDRDVMILVEYQK
jgi:hypothetical protein